MSDDLKSTDSEADKIEQVDGNKSDDHLLIDTPIPTRLDKTEVDEVTSDSHSDESSSEAALQRLIAYEKMELLKLIEEFAEDADEEDESKLIELEKLLNDFFISETKNSGLFTPKWDTLSKVHRQLNSLINSSKISKSELMKAKILANNLDKKRYIFQEIQRGIKNGQIDTTLNRLQLRMISSNMFDKIKELDEMNFENIAAILNSGLPVNFD